MVPRPAYVAPPVIPRKVSAGGMVTAIIGGMLALIGSFFLWYQTTTFANFTLGVNDLTGDYVYGWLIPIFGLLALAIAALAFSLKNTAAATIASVFGLMTFIFALLLPIHMYSGIPNVSIIDGFYFSDFGVTQIYLGGFIAMFGGLMAMGGAGALANSIKKSKQSQYPPYPPQQPGYY